jgi:ATP-dependent helicase/nuclease subunit B
MQNGLACKLLQNSIIEESKFPSMFFPEIIPILSQEDIDIAKYFHNVIPYNEAQLIFTKILLQSNLVKDFSNALNLSESLLKLYYEFIFNNVSLGNIRFLFSTDLSEQLYKNIEIIGKIFHDYEKYQNNNNKIDIAIFQRKLLLENNNNKKIILGFIDPYNKVIDQFIRNTLNNGGAVFSFKFNKIGPETNNKKIIVKELENEFEEAKYISSICNATSKILIISDNLAFNKLLIVNLISKNLDYTDYTYSGLNQNNFFDFFINIADFCLNKFDIKKLLLIMKSPLIISNYIYEIELNILRKKNYIPDFNFLIKESESLCSKESTEWLVYFYEIISKLQKPLKLDCHIGVARKLCKYNNINIEQYNEYFILLDQLSSHFNNLNLNDYISYLKTIEKDYVIKATNKDSSIIIIKAKDSRLIEDFDLLIIPSFTDNYWPKKIPSNDLLNDFMKAKIGILKAPDNSLDIILQLVYNKKTYITFARKYSSEIITKSRYLNLIKISIDKVKFPKITNLKEREKFIKFESKLMPDKISGTNIEMLIRNPYGFYAKHILKLRAIKPAIPELKFSEFGNFIHLILEKYTKNYNTDCNNKLDVIIEIALSIYKDLSRAYQTPISWISKFKKMAKNLKNFMYHILFWVCVLHLIGKLGLLPRC